MKIGFIGAGKVGCTFGRYLKQNNICVYGYYSKNELSANEAAKLTDSMSVSLYKLIENCSHIFITTPDDVILEIWNQIKTFNLKGKFIFHMSGSISSDIFHDIDNYGAFGFSLHPLISISDKYSEKEISTAIFSIEGKRLDLIKDFLSCSKIHYFVLESEYKSTYHAAAVFASNYIVAIAKIAKDLLQKCKMDDKASDMAIYSLMKSAVENIKNKSINEALTGPIIRGDINTILKHIECIGEYKQLYKELGLISLKIAEDTGKLNKEKKDELLSILGGNKNEKDSSII